LDFDITNGYLGWFCSVRNQMTTGLWRFKKTQARNSKM